MLMRGDHDGDVAKVNASAIMQQHKFNPASAHVEQNGTRPRVCKVCGRAGILAKHASCIYILMNMLYINRMNIHIYIYIYIIYLLARSPAPESARPSFCRGQAAEPLKRRSPRSGVRGPKNTPSRHFAGDKPPSDYSGAASSSSSSCPWSPARSAVKVATS